MPPGAAGVLADDLNSFPVAAAATATAVLDEASAGTAVSFSQRSSFAAYYDFLPFSPLLLLRKLLLALTTTRYHWKAEKKIEGFADDRDRSVCL